MAEVPLSECLWSESVALPSWPPCRHLCEEQTPSWVPEWKGRPEVTCFYLLPVTQEQSTSGHAVELLVKENGVHSAPFLNAEFFLS